MAKNEDLIIFSFFTKDKYYTQKAEELSESLDALELEYYLKPVEIPEGKEWPDICRDKIGYIKEFYDANPTKKVFWIDVDCQLSDLPGAVRDFSADIIGFQRGFGQPLRMGYHYKSRFWEPSFIGFNRTPEAKKFLDTAFEVESQFEGRATDDYFFEEAWRMRSKTLNFQIIPSVYANIEYRKVDDDIEPFFHFGSSGNVPDYKDKVVQHKVPWIKKKKECFNVDFKSMIKSALPESVKVKLKKALLKKHLLEDKIFKERVFAYGKSGDAKALTNIIKSQGSYEYMSEKKLNMVKVAYAFIFYRNFKSKNSHKRPIKLAWWYLPEPGNYGDWLSPYIVNKLSGRAVELVNPQSKSVNDKHLFMVGSIGKFIHDNSIVLGTGISRKENDLNSQADYKMVRGPYTRESVLANGGSCPEIYGDPAIVLPRLYTSKNKRSAASDRLLLVRHFMHLDIDLVLPETMDETSIFASHPKHIEAFIDILHDYSGVVTSAMHCFITCQAYGIPCALVTFDEKSAAVHGDGMKYRDYLAGAGLAEFDPISLPSDLVSYDFPGILSQEKISDQKIDEVLKVMKTALMEID